MGELGHRKGKQLVQSYCSRSQGLAKIHAHRRGFCFALLMTGLSYFLMVGSFLLLRVFLPSVRSTWILRIHLQALVAAYLPLHLINSQGSLSKCALDAQATLFLMLENWAPSWALSILSKEPSWEMEHPDDTYWTGRDASAEAMKHLLVPNKHPKAPGAWQPFS